jgi:hypothetical protein
MAYKARFQPLEQLTPAGWRPLPATPTSAEDGGAGTARSVGAPTGA